MLDPKIKNALWQSAAIVNDYRYSPALWRADSVGRLIYWYAFGDLRHENGWDIGHIIETRDGGNDEMDNLRVEHYITRSEKEVIQGWFRKKRRYDPLLSVYGVTPPSRPMIGTIG